MKGERKTDLKLKIQKTKIMASSSITSWQRELGKVEATPIQYTNAYMEFRKTVTITLCTRQQKRHWCIEQSFGLCGRGRGWDDLGEWHWNTYNIIYETSRQSRFDAWYWMLGAGALGRPRGMVRGGRREEGSGWGTRVYLWWIHFNIWQNQCNIVKFKNKIKFKK